MLFNKIFNKNNSETEQLTNSNEGNKFLFIPINFVIITACYNVENYVEQMILSIINQTIDFTNNIKLILINDGSTDNTLNILNKWKKRYPNNITVINNNNHGVSNARNSGINLLEHNTFVTFIDADDFIDCNYFLNIYRSIKKFQDLNIIGISCNKSYFYESNNTFNNDHPLNYKFKNDYESAKIRYLNERFDNSASSFIFWSNIILNNKLRFDERLSKFEDGYFLNSYLCLCNRNDIVLFNKNSIYYYRKRKNKSSTIDLCYEKKSTYIDVAKYAYSPLIKKFINKYGYVPDFIQNLLIYDYFWLIKYSLNLPEYIYSEYLSNDEIDTFFSLSIEIFKEISNKNIMSSSYIKGINFFYKLLMTVGFKSSYPFLPIGSGDPIDFNIVYIDYFELLSEHLIIHFYIPHNFNHNFELKINQIKINPIDQKVQIYQLFNKQILRKITQKYKLSKYRDDSSINFYINNHKCKLSYQSVFYNEGIKLIDLRNTIKKVIYSKYDSLESVTMRQIIYKNLKNCWLIIDRPDNASDNGEFLYRYLAQNKPNINTYFVLNQTAPAYKKLKQEGFRLIVYKSDLHRISFILSKYLIASDISNDCLYSFDDELILQKKIVFLQHGIIRDDLSLWLNSKRKIDLMITSTDQEYNSIVSNSSKYNLLPSQVAITGLARFDNLAKLYSEFNINRQREHKCILVQPTWRSYLKNIQNTDFINSDYFLKWSEFLRSSTLRNFYKKNKHNKIIFAAHPLMYKFLKHFRLPKYITICLDNTTYQKNFVDCNLLITDYSSVMCDVALLRKPIIYYHFDSREFWKMHTYRKGYFNYEKDGFGPVTKSIQELSTAVENYILNNFDNSEYTNSYNTFFDSSSIKNLLDGKCCERILRSILNL